MPRSARSRRFYNSFAGSRSEFGYQRWTMGLADVFLDTTPTDGSVWFHGPSGYRVRFAKNADGTFATPPGIDAVLTQASRDFTLSFNNTGERYRFSDAATPGYAGITADVDKNNNTVTYTRSSPPSPSPTPTA